MPPISQKRPRLSNKPSLIGLFDLPFEMREMIIDKMNPKTRCRFAQCSKICEKEAKESKNYMYKITLMNNRNNDHKLELHLSHTKTSESDFWFQFVDVGDGETLVIYKSNNQNNEKKVKWREFESGYSKDVRLKYLNEYLEKYKNSIKVFVFDDEVTSLNDFNIKKLKNLEKIDVKNISIGDNDVVECGFIEKNQLMSIDYLNMGKINLSFDKISDFKGNTIIGTYKDFNEEKINELLKMLKNEETHKNVRHIILHFKINSNVRNVNKIVRDLDAKDVELVPSVRESLRNVYTFKFSSKTRENGEFHVRFECRLMIEIEWKPNG